MGAHQSASYHVIAARPLRNVFKPLGLALERRPRRVRDVTAPDAVSMLESGGGTDQRPCNATEGRVFPIDGQTNWSSPMPTWVKCTTTDGNEIRVNLDHVVTIRPYQKDRGGTGSEITFAGGAPSSLVVKESLDHLADSRRDATTS
jgi:hypothetical protein